MENQIASPLSQ